MQETPNFILGNGILTHNTSDAQQSLRRIIENYQSTCRFILTGNYPYKLIDAIRSRVKEFEFDPIPKGDSITHLTHIAKQEGIDVDREFLEKLVEIHHGDLRTQIVEFESHYQNGDLDPDSIDTGTDYVKLHTYISQPNYMAAIRVADRETLNQLFNYIMSRDDIPGRVKADVSILFAKYTWRMDKSADRDIQINALVAELIKRMQEHQK
jgi:DNA polymerase III delta prime subunit